MLAPTPASPESAGMSKAAFDRIEDHLKQRYIESGRFPGTQLLVYRRGKVVHRKKARAERVVDVVIHIGDVVGQGRDLCLKARPA